MGPKIDLNLHAKSLKRPILGAQLRVLKPPKKLQLTLLKAPPIEPTCLIYANWGRGKKLKHGVPKKKERWQKNQREPQNLGFLSPKTKREPQNRVFSVQNPKDSQIFGIFGIWILPPPVIFPGTKTRLPELTCLKWLFCWNLCPFFWNPILNSHC